MVLEPVGHLQGGCRTVSYSDTPVPAFLRKHDASASHVMSADPAARRSEIAQILTPQQSALTLASFVLLFGGIRTIRIETHSKCKNAFDQFQAVRGGRAPS